MLYRRLLILALVCLHTGSLLAQTVPQEHRQHVKEVLDNALISIVREAAGKLIELDTSIKKEQKKRATNELKSAGDIGAVISLIPGGEKNKAIIRAAADKGTVEGEDINVDSGAIVKIYQSLADQTADQYKLAKAAKKNLIQLYSTILSDAVKTARSAIPSEVVTAPLTNPDPTGSQQQNDNVKNGEGNEGKENGQETDPEKKTVLKNDPAVEKQKTIDSLAGMLSGASRSEEVFRYSAAGLVLLLLVMGILFFLTRKKNNQSVRELKTLLQDKNNQIQYLATDLNNEQQKTSSMARQAELAITAASRSTAAATATAAIAAPMPAPAQQPVAIWQNNPLGSDTYFFAEAMVTAGPRKNFGQDAIEGDYGLGEDVTGFIVRQDKAFFWVLDGTSDSDQLTKPLTTGDVRQEEIFSSRLLAQSIGWNLQQVIQHLPKQFSSQELLKQAIQSTERDWQTKITGSLQAGAAAIEQALQGKNGILQCSTTIVFGILDLKGRLDVCRVGDCKLVTWPGKNDFPKTTGRQFVTLQQKEKDISLSFNDFTDLRSQHFQLEGIKTLIAMTDGISPQMETWLQHSELDFSDRKTREIIAHFKQKTYDDKAMCIIQIKG